MKGKTFTFNYWSWFSSQTAGAPDIVETNKIETKMGSFIIMIIKWLY